MSVLCKGYFSGNIIHNNCSNIIPKLFNKRWLQLKKYNFRYFQKYSSFMKSNAETNTEVKAGGAYTTFERMLELKRLQAKKSILIQVHSEQSCPQLREYCLRFGNVSKMIHYSLRSNMHFVIVEFEEESSTADALCKSTHVDNAQIIPVRSQFLWFKANDNGKQKIKTANIETASDVFVKFGSVYPPSYEEISSWLSTCKDVSEQMTLLSHATHLEDLGTRLRFLTALQVENTLSGMFPFVRALPYGSSVNSFGKINCDLDIVVSLDHQPNNLIPDNRLIFQTKTSLVNNRTQQQRYIESIGDLIERYLPGCCGVKKILLARVPILKFRHEYTGTECDLSLMNMTGVYMSELLYIYASIDARVRPLIFTVRYWAQVINLTNPTPGRWITNFSLTLLVLFYLQHLKIIPTLDQLIKLSKPEDKRFADDVNCTFLRDINPLLTNDTVDNSSLAELLKGFFEYFALFDFDSHAISLRSGKVLPKQEYSALYIVNPLESHLNVSKNVSAEELGRFRIEIGNAARYLDREIRLEDRSEEGWGLITLFQSSHYNSKAKNVIYSTIQKKQQSTNRLVTITELFDEEQNEKAEASRDISKENLSYHLHSQRTSRKR